jgi:hypothetical protein
MSPHLQNNQSKMDWRCGSHVECLLCEGLVYKWEVLSSNSKRKFKEKSKEGIIFQCDMGSDRSTHPMNGGAGRGIRQ